jgi:serine/threonine-protein phosphatase CPPED1
MRLAPRLRVWLFGLIAAVVLLAGALGAQPERFFFVQITDPQLGMYTSNANFAQETANLEFAVATVNRLRPAFVVVTGDLVNKGGDAAQIAEYRRIVGKVDRAIPVYSLPGNHDIENEPTPETLAAYTKAFGPDHFAFRCRGLAGIVLNSGLMKAPAKAQAEADAQDRWLRDELDKAHRDGSTHVVVFQHHPVFLKDAAEPDGYDNIPVERRAGYLRLFHEFGVKHVFGGHYHQNVVVQDGDLEIVTTGPIGMPLRGAKSGLRIAVVNERGITHRYYELGELPNTVKLTE